MLEAFTDERPAWSASDLAAGGGGHRRTADRGVSARGRAGLVCRDPGPESYRLGSGLMALGARAARANPVRAISLPELAQLAAATGETATLEVLSGHEMVIIEEIPGGSMSSGSYGQSRHIGSRWPIYATSTGKALLAHLPPEEIAPLLAQPIRQLTEKTITSTARLRDCLEEIRRLGYAVAADELEMGFVAVGAAILAGDGRAVAAISLGGTRTRLADDRLPEIGALVRSAAGRISHRLGYRS
jgi:DNA-binding IclR family transcriptional regulator